MMMLSELGLTPKQQAEVEQLDPILVEEWLEEVDRPGVPNRTAWFLTGVRTGQHPTERADPIRARKIRTAHAWIRNVGAIVSESEMIEELFDGTNAQLARWRSDEELREQMSEAWRAQQ